MLQARPQPESESPSLTGTQSRSPLTVLGRGRGSLRPGPRRRLRDADTCESQADRFSSSLHGGKYFSLASLTRNFLAVTASVTRSLSPGPL
jgi:hypothetical protein